MGHGTEPNGVLLSQHSIEVFKSTYDSSTPDKPGSHGKSNFLCTWIRVPLLALVGLLTALLIMIIIVIVAFTGKRNEVPGAAPARPLPDPCADDWIWYRKKCYLFSEDLRDWDAAQNFCTSQNSSLAHIETQQELDFVFKWKDHADHWIGLRRDPGQLWKWTDGSEFNKLFQVLQDSDCVYLNDVVIKSAGCHTNRKWICTMPARSHF